MKITGIISILVLLTACSQKAEPDLRPSLPYIANLPAVVPGSQETPMKDAYLLRDWQLKGIESSDANLMDWKGEVIFLNIWATWCGPCRAEIPAIEKMAEALKDENVKIALISGEDSEIVTDWLKNTKITVPMYVAEDILPAFQTMGIPATFIIDKDGFLRTFHMGAAQWDSEEVISYLKKLAAQ